MLAIKASPGYMGNPQGEGAIWQRTPAGGDVKVRNDMNEIPLANYVVVSGYFIALDIVSVCAVLYISY
jgi:hypothetical protein